MLAHKIFVVIWSLFCGLDALNDPDTAETIDERDFCNCTLILSHVVHRHGDRNPIKLYPNDPYKDNSYWPEGLGRLTKIGIQQEYALGKYLRERYRPLLENKGYSKDLVYVQSTDLDRTLMSAAAVMAGLFPPEGDEIWNPELMWQPVPIHTVPKDLDYLLYGGKSCPRYDLALNNYLKSPEMTTLYEQDKHLFQYLEEYSGMKIENYFDLLILHDTLRIEEDRYKTLPEWTNSVFGPGTEFECGANYAFQIPAATPELARLSSGFLIGDIFGRCNQKVKGTLETNRSLWIYSAHDSTIANLLCSFGKFYPFPPPYASSLHFDLYKCKDNNYLQITYRHSTIETVLNFRKCGSKCSIEDLCKMYKKIIPNKSFDEECQLPTYSKANPNGKIMVICLGLAVPIVFISSWLIFSRMRGIEMKSDVMK